MKFKNVIILIMLLILSLSIGVVSASDSADFNTDINTINTEHNNLNTNINTINTEHNNLNTNINIVNTEDDELKINNTTYYKNDISNLNDTSKINIKPILEDESAKNINNSNKVSTTVKTKTVYVKTSKVIK